MNISSEIKITVSHYCGELTDVKPILIPYYDFDDVLSLEQIWGEMLEPDKYLVKSIPLYVNHIALGDLLLVEKESDGQLYFEDLLETSENSTVRIVFLNYIVEKVDQILEEINNFGCGWVGFEGGSYYSINIDKNIDYSKIQSYLQINQNIIDYQEGCLSDKHRKDLLLVKDVKI